MALLTLSERFAAIEKRLMEAELRLARLASYAESTNSMNHEAIRRLSEAAGLGPWPPKT